MDKGTQIIHLPKKANGNPNHPMRRTGFIDHIKNGKAYCWFWRKDEQNRTFHTIEDEEPTEVDLSSLVYVATTEKKYVDHWVSKLEKRNDS